MKKKILSTFIFLLFFLSLQGQTDKGFVAFSRHFENGNFIRLFPSDYSSWIEIAKHGLVIERIQLDSNAGNHQRITGTPLVPLSKGELVRLTDSIPEVQLIIQCLHPVIENNLLSDIKAMDRSFMACMLGMIQRPELSLLAGLGFVDTRAKNSGNCLYKIYADGSQTLRDTFWLMSSPNQENARPSISRPSLIVESNSCIISPSEHDADIVGYYVEKSTDSGMSFIRLSQVPTFFGLKLNGRPAEYCADTIGKSPFVIYRLVGIDIFGLNVALSDTVVCHRRIKLVGMPENVTATDSNNSAVIHWDYQTKLSPEISGFKILKYDSVNDETAIEICSLAAVERQVKITETGYYSIIAYGPIGYSNESYKIFIQLADVNPPASPTILSAFVDSFRIVHLVWNQNLETDIYGYKVLFSPFPNLEMSYKTNRYIFDTTYLDTISNIYSTDSIYYRVIAADKRFNESNPDALIPVAIAHEKLPLKPLIQSINTTENTVMIKYMTDKSTQWSSYLQVDATDGKGWRTIAKVRNEDSVFVDSNVTGNKNSTYCIVTKMESGSAPVKSQEVYVELPEPNLLDKVEFSEVIKDSLNHLIYFYWKEPAFGDISHYTLLSNGRTFAVVPAGIQSFRSLESICGKPPYSIVAYTKNGRRSKL